MSLKDWADAHVQGFFGTDRTVEPYRFSEAYSKELAARPWLEQQADRERAFAEGAAVVFGLMGMAHAIGRHSDNYYCDHCGDGWGSHYYGCPRA